MTTLDLAAAAREEAARRLGGFDVDSTLARASISTWRGRMVNEHGSARVFAGLAAQMREAGFDAVDVTAVEAFADEERRHGVLCGAAVEHFGGDARAEALPDVAFPLHEDATSKREAVLRNVLSVSCLSETIAVALIGKEREEMPDSPLRALLTEIWADEVGHARFGWRLVAAHAPTLTAEERAGLDAYLALAFAHVEAHELAHLPDHDFVPPGGERCGLCSGKEARALFYATIERVVVPNLEALGLAARAAWATRSTFRAVAS